MSDEAVMPQGFESPEAAESAFYQAFQAADTEAMMRVWAPDDSVACVHPLGGRLDGFQAIRDGWARLFEQGPPVRFRLTRLQQTRSDALAVHSLYEHLELDEGGEHPPLAVTNVYREYPDGWFMIVHHASPMRPTSEITAAGDNDVVH